MFRYDMGSKQIQSTIPKFRNTFKDLLMRDPADTRRYLDVDSTRNER